ncbi:MAG: hypothetical protein ACRDLT_14170, partial [Solirubrobacteraceae bacterium]
MPELSGTQQTVGQTVDTVNGWVEAKSRPVGWLVQLQANLNKAFPATADAVPVLRHALAGYASAAGLSG